VRILGIDPGSRCTGFGIIEVRGDRAVCITHGVIKTGGGEFPRAPHFLLDIVLFSLIIYILYERGESNQRLVIPRRRLDN